MMSNFHASVVARGRAAFDLAFRLFFFDIGDERTGKPSRKAVGYVITPALDEAPDLLTLYWVAGTHDGPECVPLPYGMDVDDALEFAWRWFQKADPGEGPDNDGTVTKGAWSLKSPDSGWHHAFVEIRPEWAIYGK